MPATAIPRSTESANAGLTLLEVLVTVAIMAIVLSIGTPSFTSIIADQRVRVATSDLHGDLIFARANAINNQRRIVVDALDGVNWNAGWRVCVAATPNSYDCSGSPEILRVGQPLSRGLNSCGSPGLVTLAFRPDGRIDLNPPLTTEDFIRISDNLGNNNIGDDKIRTLYFGVSGRIIVMNGNGGSGGATPC